MACTGTLKFEGGVGATPQSDLVEFKNLLEVLHFSFAVAHPHHLGQSTHDPIINPFSVTCLQGGHSAQLFQACVEGVLFDKVTFSAYMTDQKTKKHVLFYEVVLENAAVEGVNWSYAHSGSSSALDESFTLVGTKVSIKTNHRGTNEKQASHTARANVRALALLIHPSSRRHRAHASFGFLFYEGRGRRLPPTRARDGKLG